MSIKTSKRKSEKDVYIVTGGNLSMEILSQVDLTDGIIIGVDRGSEWLIANNLIPDYFIGDFDSVGQHFLESVKEQFPEKIHISPVEKDETDTDLAMRLAVSLEPENIIIIGGTGTRLDHVVGNIHLLLQAEKKLITAQIIDLNNRVQLLLPDRKKQFTKSGYKYLSIIPFSEKVEGINLDGFKYSLNNGVMEIGNPFGISNEIIKKTGTISITKGILIVIESKD